MDAKAVDFKNREDKLKKWLEQELGSFLFDAFSEKYCSSRGMSFMAGVEIPIKPEDLAAFHDGTGVSPADLADNMITVMGANTCFKHRDAYIKYLAMHFSADIIRIVCARGGAALKEGLYRKACIYFRSALLLDHSDVNALFGYACDCREWYLSLEGSGETELISLLKAESTEFFETLTRLCPEYAPPYYFLGYAYVNGGLYTKAKLIWQRYLELAEKGEPAAAGEGRAASDAIEEIKERISSLEDPVKIEEGINHLLAGRRQQCLAILEPYVGTSFDKWWPLHYYLACAYSELGFEKESEEGFLRVLALKPSHEESCERLASIYAARGEADLAEKYLSKAEIIRKNRE